MEVKIFVFNPFQENTYLVFDKTNEAVVIDAGCSNNSELEMVTRYIEDKNLKVKHLINTHCHLDHVLGVSQLKHLYSARFMAHIADKPLLEALDDQARMFSVKNTETPMVDQFFADGDEITFGESSFRVIHTPGHTRGGVCFYAEQHKVIFTGDTLFSGSIGRADLPGGSYNSLIESISTKLFTLPHDVTVYSGHGPSTSIGYEKLHNPFFK